MIRIILATSNRGKQIEIEAFLNSSNSKEKDNFEVLAYSDLIEPFEIEENGTTFKENAIIKAEAVFDELRKKFPSDDKLIIIADDSGISIKALNNEPNIFSARYSGANATDKSNVQKVIDNLNKINTAESQAFYTSAIAIVSVQDNKKVINTVHGWLYGKVINEARGSNGFGYDPIFIPENKENISKTLGELSANEKESYSHRIKALRLAKVVINSIKRI